MGLFFKLVIPLLSRGLCLETHSQNVLVRFDPQNKSVVGFAIRDMNGVKIHIPTLQDQGIAVDERLAEIAETRCNDINALWKRAHRTLIQNHAGFLLRSLGLDNSQGWSIVRDELENVLLSPDCPMGQSLHQFFWAGSMGYPCFLGAILRGKPLDVSCNI
jgi:siderophore synthetase component